VSGTVRFAKRKGGERVAEPRPTNEYLAELLQRVMYEVGELKDGQQQLAADLRKLAESSRS
jgi:hypothetical protein